MASWLERFLYRRADAVTVLSEDLRDNVAGQARGGRRPRARRGRSRTSSTPSGSRRPSARTPTGPSTASTGRTVVMYAGNVGLSQSLDLVRRRRSSAPRPRGPGVRDQRRRVGPRRTRARPPPTCDNLRFVDMQPRERLRRGARRRRPAPGAAAHRAGPLQRAVEAVLDPRRGPPRAGQRRRRHRGRDARSSVPVPASSVRPEDPEAFSAALDGLLDDPDRRPRWARPVAASSRAGCRPPRWARPTSGSSPTWPDGGADRSLIGRRGTTLPERTDGNGAPGSEHGVRATTVDRHMGKASSAKKIKRVQQAGVSRAPGQRRNLGYPALIIGIVIVGSVLVFFARGRAQRRCRRGPGRPTRTTGTRPSRSTSAARSSRTPATSVPTPRASTPTGRADPHPPVRRRLPPARTPPSQVFADQTGLEVTDDSFTLPDGTTYTNGDDCTDEDGKKQEGRVAMYVWPPQATDATDPEIVTKDIAGDPLHRGRPGVRARLRARGRRGAACRRRSRRSPTRSDLETAPDEGSTEFTTTDCTGRRGRRRPPRHPPPTTTAPRLRHEGDRPGRRVRHPPPAPDAALRRSRCCPSSTVTMLERVVGAAR